MLKTLVARLLAAAALLVLLLILRRPAQFPLATLPDSPFRCDGAPDDAWRLAEYEAQAAQRRVALLHAQVRARSPLATEKRRSAFGANASTAALHAALHEARRDAARLARAARPPGAPPNPLLARLPRSRARAVNVSFVLQYFRNSKNIQPIVERLFTCTHGRAGAGGLLPPGLTSELVAHVDSRGDGAAWDDAVKSTAGEASFVTVILSDDLHEVHGTLRAHNCNAYASHSAHAPSSRLEQQGTIEARRSREGSSW